MIGQTISHYQVIEKLGEGGMGMVFKAKDLTLDRFVALKFLSSSLSGHDEGKARFIQEAKAASALDHPNICAIYEISQAEDGQLFIAMGYYEGKTLKDILVESALDLNDAVGYANQIVQGLNRAHQSGIVHRDIKPANIIITEHNEVKILDFGLAKLAGEAKLTRSGETLGTAAYMSPEQIQGKTVDHRSDIFSWGVIFYEMLTGRLPFPGEYEHAVMYAIMNEEPEPLGGVQEELPEEVGLIIDKALAKEQEDRYQQTSELVEDLEVLRSNLRGGGSSSVLHAHTRPVTKSRQASDKQGLRISRPVLAGSLVSLVLILLLIAVLPAGRSLVSRLFDVGGTDAKHIAILPFSTIGDDPDTKALCDGLVETLTSKLSQLEQFQGSLWVVPASEVRRSNVTTASEAKQVFGTNMVITGSVQRFQSLLRLLMNLIDANNLRQVSSKVIDDPMTDNSILQDEAVIKLAEMLNVEILPESKRILQAGATTVPGAYEFYLQGRGYLQDYDKLENIIAAIKLFERALEADPNYALAYAGLGEAYLRRFQETKEVVWVKHSEENIERAVKLENMLAPVHITRGLLFNETGRYREALNDFQKAIELDSHNAEAYNSRAKAFLALGEIEKAEQTHKKAISMKPDYWGGYNDLGIFYNTQGRYKDAIEQFQHVIELTPQNARGHRNLGAMYHQLNRPDEAIKYYKKAIDISPDYSVYSNLATLYFREGQYVDAARMYEKALELRDTDYRVWGYLAAAYQNTPEEKHRAETAYREAIKRAEEQLEINPNDPYVLLRLAAYYIEFDQSDKALSLVKKAANVKSKDAEILFRIGLIYEQLGERKQALSWLEKALIKGYSRSELQNQPTLSDLRNDEKYRKMIKKLAPAN